MPDAEATQPDFPLARADGPPVEAVRELFRVAANRAHLRLADLYDVDVPVRMASVSLTHYGEVAHRMGREPGGACASFHLAGTAVAGAMCIEGPLLYQLAALLLGADPDEEMPLYRARSASRLDLQIARRVALDVLHCMGEAAMTEPAPSFELQRVAGSMRPLMAIAPATSVFEIALDLGPPDLPLGLITVILPVRIANVVWPHSARQRDAASSAGLRDRILPLPVEVVAELARVKMSLAQLRKLKAGDVLELGNLPEVSIRVGSKTALFGEGGERGAARCVRIVRRGGEPV